MVSPYRNIIFGILQQTQFHDSCEVWRGQKSSSAVSNSKIQLWYNVRTHFGESQRVIANATGDLMSSQPIGRTENSCGRREFLRFGSGLAAAGFAMPWLASDAVAKGANASSSKPARAQSCILVYLLGGPPHLDTFDLKPDAPAEIRGEFQPISTNVNGLHICELLPQLAAMADKYALIRSVTRKNSNHTPMIYYTLTGRDTAQPDRDNDIRPPQPDDFPHWGSVVSKFKRSAASVPGYVALPEVAIRSSTEGEFKRARTLMRGGGPGFLGAKYAPLGVNGEPGSSDAIPAFALPEEVSAERFERRASLIAQLDRGLRGSAETQTSHDVRQQAVMLTGSANRGQLDLFSLESESSVLRDRYGRHRFGQALLLARRLTEAGVPMVAVHFNEMTVCDGWDTHSKNFAALKQELLPMLDQSLSALLEDLNQRGRLDETLVTCMGEFGRTPKINANAGRDHWGECSSTLLAGGGIQGGQVLGASDRHGATPISHPVDPADVQATVYHCLGLSPELLIYDRSQRPFTISTGKVMQQLL